MDSSNLKTTMNYLPFDCFRINWKLCSHDVEYLVLPLFHIYGLMRSLSTLDQGATVVLDQRFQVERAAKAFETYKVKEENVMSSLATSDEI